MSFRRGARRLRPLEAPRRADRRQLAYHAEQPAHLVEAAHLEGEEHARVLVARLRCGAGDLDFLAREDVEDVSHQARMVVALDLNVEREASLQRVASPLRCDQPLGCEKRDIGTALPVYRDAPAAGHEADDVITRYRLATLGQHGEELVHPDHQDVAAAPRLFARAWRRRL